MDIEKFEKSFIKFLTEDIEKFDIVKETLEKGYPATYTDEQGRLIKEYPNGKKFLVGFNPTTKKTFDGEEIHD
ncbi:MAG: hypothetical protein LBQ34_07685 [Alphaproteobacteria bacterium]|jgi:hypothetical protein|nr:hypothetical protein [Alphaproteobacteria bacterium]